MPTAMNTITSLVSRSATGPAARLTQQHALTAGAQLPMCIEPRPVMFLQATRRPQVPADVAVKTDTLKVHPPTSVDPCDSSPTKPVFEALADFQLNLKRELAGLSLADPRLEPILNNYTRLQQLATFEHIAAALRQEGQGKNYAALLRELNKNLSIQDRAIARQTRQQNAKEREASRLKRDLDRKHRQSQQDCRAQARETHQERMAELKLAQISARTNPSSASGNPTHLPPGVEVVARHPATGASLSHIAPGSRVPVCQTAPSTFPEVQSADFAPPTLLLKTS